MATTNDKQTGPALGIDAADASQAHTDAIETTIDRGMATDFGAAPEGGKKVDEVDAVTNVATASAPAAEDADNTADIEDTEDDESEDSLTYSNGVIEKIVALATREVPHVLGMKGNLMHFVQEQFGAENLTKGVTVEVTDDNRVVVNISVIIEYGSYAPAIFEDVKERVTERLGAMTGLEVAGINLRIEDVVTREEYDAGQKHLIDSLMPGGDDEEELQK